MTAARTLLLIWAAIFVAFACAAMRIGILRTSERFAVLGCCVALAVGLSLPVWLPWTGAVL